MCEETCVDISFCVGMCGCVHKGVGIETCMDISLCWSESECLERYV